MFVLHDKTRRLLCRCLFLVMCALPASALLAVIVSRALPGYVSSREVEMSRVLGLTVSLGEVSHPRPGMTLLKDVKLADPETGVAVAQIRMVEMAQHDGLLVLVLSQPEVKTSCLVQLGELLWGRLLRRGELAGSAIRWVAAEVTLSGESNSQTLTDVHGRIEPLPTGPQATISFRVAGLDMPEPAQIRLVRNRQLIPPTTRVEIHTGGSPLPCQMFSAWYPGLVQLGERSTFAGSVSAARTNEGWQGELAGRLEGVDLDRLVSDQFPHKLSGEARIVFRGARFHADRLTQAAGWMQAGPGVVSGRLLASATRWLRMTGPPLHGQQVDVSRSYRKLALSFVIDRDGLAIHGQCDAAPEGTILADASGGLLGESAIQPQPVVNLVRTLVPDSQVQVPATRQTASLLAALPLPMIVPPEEDKRMPHASLRFGKQREGKWRKVKR